MSSIILRLAQFLVNPVFLTRTPHNLVHGGTCDGCGTARVSHFFLAGWDQAYNRIFLYFLAEFCRAAGGCYLGAFEAGGILSE